MNAPGSTVHAIEVPHDAVCRLGVAGNPLSPTALLVYLALLGMPAEFDGDISYDWIGQRVGETGRPAERRRLFRLLKDLEHAGLVDIDHLQGRPPRLTRAVPAEPTVRVPVRLLWSTSAREGGPARDGASGALVALLCILAICDPLTRTGSAALPALTAYRQRNRPLPNSDVQEVKVSRARLELLAADTMTWTRPRTLGKHGRGTYRVAYDFSSLGVRAAGSPPRSETSPDRLRTTPLPAASKSNSAAKQCPTPCDHGTDSDLRRVLLRAHATLAAGGPSSVDDTLAILALATGWDRGQARAAFEAMRAFEIALGPGLPKSATPSPQRGRSRTHPGAFRPNR